MDPSARTLRLLRRRGVWLVAGLGEGGGVRRWLEGRRIPVTAVRALDVDDAGRLPRRPVLLVDPGHLDRARLLASALTALDPAPPLIVVSDALTRGLAELGWSGGTWGTHFVRAQVLDDDLAAALDEALARAPELDESDGPPPAVAGTADARFDVDGLRAALGVQLAWAAPVVERVGGGLELRARLPELDERAATLVLTWHDGSDERLRLELHAPLPVRAARFVARRERGGLRGLLARLDDPLVGEPSFDAAMTVSADDAGLAEARALAPLLDDLGALAELTFDREALRAVAGELTRADALALCGAALALWRALTRARLGA